MDKHVFTDKQKKLIAWAAIAIFLLLSAAVGWFIGRPLVRFASRPEEFRLWVDGHGLLGMAAYVGMVFLQVVVAVIPGEPLEISGGYAFGALRGSVLCLLGGVLGSVAVFALVRTCNKSGGEVQRLMAGDRPLYLAVADQMARHGASLVVGTGYRLDIRDVRRQCPKSFLLLPECDGENAVPAFDEYGHGAMLVDFDLQYAEEPAQAVPAAAQLLKQWVTVV